MRKGGPVRSASALVLGGVVAWVAAVVLGEYEVTVVVGLAAALIVPLAVREAMAVAAGVRGHPWELVATAALAGFGLAWGTWLSGGRGLQPWPVGGWVAVACGAAWPLALALGAGRRRRSGRVGTEAG